jgi:thioredoxin 1
MVSTELKSVSQLKKILTDAKKARKNVVLDFYATWCGPCKRIAQPFEQFAAQYPGVVFVKINVDEFPDISQSYGVRGMPTFVVEFGDHRLGAGPELVSGPNLELVASKLNSA